ncbi:EXS domain-containing protein [Pyrenophora tritici-repentis]|nr:EXS domain-containing protein [Pyrenophora tritici-repentis]KAI0575199.1 EXS domain-containing protein [Pyrenophora tritici-repentis]KAI0579019.1 EXS domain-containing protein [Pyrenophora tritici-repentis]KAI0605134.1 EXS domain-containing protein [Pyrenophora tritici-repentis]KAI0618602.1 EXS domain-containing protein [Pyrenophora tritici-repentis]
MKFAKELERELEGKKKLKAIGRALRNVEQSTPRPFRWTASNALFSSFDAAPKYTYLNRDHAGPGETSSPRDQDGLRSLAITNSRNRHQKEDEEPLTQGNTERPGLGNHYGSIIGSPPSPAERRKAKDKAWTPPSLTLPGAALDPDRASSSLHKQQSVTLPPPAEPENDHKTSSPKHKHKSLPARYMSVFSPKRINSNPSPITQSHDQSRPPARRIFSLANKSPLVSPRDVPPEAYRDLDFRQADFYNFLDSELEKIEKFYKQKEDEATQRLAILRDQLHIMRDRRIDDIIKEQTDKINAKAHKHDSTGGQSSYSIDENQRAKKFTGATVKDTFLNPIDAALDAINAGKYGNSTKNISQLASPRPQDGVDRRDFARRPELADVPYQTAKRKLKVALQEYYRGLELLKSYALLNRTAFRKIIKKYDKTVNARPSSRYMNEKVNQAWFVNSDVIDGHIRATEDLYARYFEKGNHKVAIGKLRIKSARAGDYTDNTFRNGLLLAAGIILGVQGIIQAHRIADLSNTDGSTLAVNTSYLLQIYAGYFLVNFLVLCFCLACRVWHENKINYVFIFEYDTRHHLDWRQLSELPCWCLFMLGLCMLMNFHKVGGESLYLYWPVILIAISVAILFCPFKILYFRTRMWLLYSLWRLLLAGIYPVEWRDFYLGDMFCSLTYSMSGVALFFCLYAHDWINPPQCNSSHLRITGFLTTLPGIWRLLQCLRRYNDTGNKFPHLLNGGKYVATILFNASISIYRMDQSPQTKAVFIVFATINGIYTSFWDIYYDWSLGDPNAKNPFLRKELGYKKVWWYYTAIIIDPILRFNWIMYAIIPLQLQHSAMTSFCVAVSEVCRRGMWSVFRVENEHCTNVGRFRASRDVPLPYYMPSGCEEPEDHTSGIPRNPQRIDEEQPDAQHPYMPTQSPPPKQSKVDPELMAQATKSRQQSKVDPEVVAQAAKQADDEAAAAGDDDEAASALDRIREDLTLGVRNARSDASHTEAGKEGGKK